MTYNDFRIALDLVTLSVGSRMPGRGKRRFFLGSALAALIAVCTPLPIAGTATVEAAQSTTGVYVKRLTGRWVRPDGGYVLVLGDIKKDGGLKASYFNPRPINVSRSELRRTKDGMIIYVELRDVNYPGSNYKLRYDPASDRMKGNYFQAVERETYEVEFVRLQ
jgi:hypothetical protein